MFVHLHTFSSPPPHFWLIQGINAVTPNHEQADPKSNQNKNSKTPSPYEEVLESHKEVQNGGEPLQVQNEDQSVYR